MPVTNTETPVGEDARSIKVDDITMSYRTFGSGYPLVLIMGSASTMELWESGLLSKLAEKYQVIIFDNRGMGGSGSGTREFSIEQFADDTAGLLDALAIPKAHILGWSMGAMIAQELALRHPTKVDKLILYAAHCDAALFPPSPEVIEQLTDTTGTPQERGMRYIGVLFPAEWMQNNGQRISEVFFRPLGNIPGEVVGKQAMAIELWKGTTERLGAIHNATLLLHGALDVLVPPQNAQYLSEHLPNALLHMSDNGGHGLMFQFPDYFGDVVIEFLA